MNDQDDRREFTRVHFRVHVTLQGDHETVVSADVRDVSLKGLYAVASSRLPPGAACRVLLDLGGDGSTVRLEMRGQIVRLDGAGLSVEFTDMTLDTYWHLQNLIRFNATDPAQVEAEFRSSMNEPRKE